MVYVLTMRVKIRKIITRHIQANHWPTLPNIELTITCNWNLTLLNFYHYLYTFVTLYLFNVNLPFLFSGTSPNQNFVKNPDVQDMGLSSSVDGERSQPAAAAASDGAATKGAELAALLTAAMVATLNTNLSLWNYQYFDLVTTKRLLCSMGLWSELWCYTSVCEVKL